MRYRIQFEPMDIEADTPKQAIEEYNYRCGMKTEWPEIMRIVPIDKDGFPIKLGGELNERK